MQPFRIICETCHARLKVGSASAVGEIHACPKCGSMVEIRLPAEGPPPSSVGSASIEIGVGALPIMDEPATGTAETAAVAPLTVPAARGGRSYLLWGVGGTAIFVAGGIAALSLLGGSKPAQKPDVPKARAPAGDSAVSKLARPEPSAVETSNDAAAETDADEPADVGSDESKSPDASAVAAAPATEEAGPAVAEAGPAADLPSLPALPPVEPAPSVAAAATSNDTQAAATNEQTPPSQPVMKLDPLDFDPSQFGFSAGNAAGPDAESASIAGNAEVNAGPPREDASRTAAMAAAPAPAVDRSLHVELGPMPDGDAPPQGVEEQLATRIESVSIAEMELFRFVETVSDLAGVAVTLDPFELELAGVAPRQKVSIDAKDTTVEDALRQVLNGQRLELETAGAIRVVLVGGEGRREVTHDVANLAGAEDATAVAELVRRFVSPDSWTAAGGGATMAVEESKMRVEHTKRGQHEVLIFGERLRLARGLPQRSRYPAALLRTVSPYETAAPALKKRVTLTFLPWSPLGAVLRQWQEASQLTVLVDWQALAEVGLGPSSPIECSAIDRSWEEVFDGILEPIGLAWWAVDGETIQITSREAVEGIRRVEFHAVAKEMRDQFTTGEALIEILQGEMAKLAAEDGAAQPAVMEYDEPSGRLIVLATPDAHRYLTQRLGRGAKQVASRKP